MPQAAPPTRRPTPAPAASAAATPTSTGTGDRDNWGVDGVSHRRCSAVPGVAQAITDCNDSLPGVHPGAVEVCNGVDDNCNGTIDEGFPEACL